MFIDSNQRGNSTMDRLTFLIVIVTCVDIDLLTFFCARDVLKDLLRGAIGKNSAKKKWSSVSFLDKIALQKLKIICDKEAGLLKKYYFYYHAFLCSLPLKYLIVLLVKLCYDTPNHFILSFTGIVIFLLSIAFLLVFRIPQLPHGRTKYIHDRRKKH